MNKNNKLHAIMYQSKLIQFKKTNKKTMNNKFSQLQQFLTIWNKQYKLKYKCSNMNNQYKKTKL